MRIGVASPRVLVRTVDLPTMSDDELAGALRFQAQELIPIPLEDAVLDFQVLESLADARGAGRRPAAAADVAGAARRGPQGPDRSTSPARSARPASSVAAVDLVPLALVRSVGRRVSDNGSGVEAIVSIGGGVTVVVVHELGIPRFVRILGSGGRSVTDAIARDLELTPDQAEARQAADRHRAAPTSPTRARRAMARPISDLVEQIRGSLDYYRTQPGLDPPAARSRSPAAARSRPGSSTSSSTPSACRSTSRRPREHFAIGDIGFPDDQLPAARPVPARTRSGSRSAGCSPASASTCSAPASKEPVDRSQLLAHRRDRGRGPARAARWPLLPEEEPGRRRAATSSRRPRPRTARCRARSARSPTSQQRQTQIETLAAQTQSLLATDVSWSSVLQALSRTIPSDVWLTSFQSTVAGTGSERRRRRRRRRAGADHRRRRPRSVPRTSPPSARASTRSPPGSAGSAPTSRTSPGCGCRARRASAGSGSGSSTGEPDVEHRSRGRHLLVHRQPDRQGQERPGRPVQGDAVNALKRNPLIVIGAGRSW